MIDVVLWCVVGAMIVLCCAGIWWAWNHPQGPDDDEGGWM